MGWDGTGWMSEYMDAGLTPGGDTDVPYHLVTIC
jgi:hypothetical protein